jgi:hypothetical protein
MVLVLVGESRLFFLLLARSCGPICAGILHISTPFANFHIMLRQFLNYFSLKYQVVSNMKVARLTGIYRLWSFLKCIIDMYIIIAR